MKLTELLARIFLGLIALAFLKVGIETMVDPRAVLANVDISLETSSALSSMRAVYGGMHFVFGALCVYTIFKNVISGLGLVALYTLGFAIGRISGIILDGTPNQFVVTWLITEIAAFAIAVFLLLRISVKRLILP